MFVEESERVAQVIGTIPKENLRNVLDVGSSERGFRTIVQPHIEDNVFAPLVRSGCIVKHLDIKEGDGIDICVDLSKELDWSFALETFSLILCTNILEHVSNRDFFLSNLLKFARKGTYILFTVPRKYFRHNDPIDTMYRPTPHGIQESLLRHCSFEILYQEILEINTERYYLAWGKPFRLFPFRFQVHRWRYYLKPFRWKVSFLLIRTR